MGKERNYMINLGNQQNKFNIGIMTKRENALVVKRGVTLSVTVRKTLIRKAVEKHHRFNKDIIKQDDKKF